MSTSEIKGAMYIGSVVITKSLTKLKSEESEIVIQLAINKVCHLFPKSHRKVVDTKLNCFLAFDKNWAVIKISFWIKTGSNSQRNVFNDWTSTNGNNQ